MRSGNHLLLTWKAVTEDVNGDPGTISKYQVWRGLEPDFLAGDSSNPSPLAEVDASTLSYVDENDIADPTNYYYLVKAVNDVGLSSAASGHVGKFTQAMTAGSQPPMGKKTRESERHWQVIHGQDDHSVCFSCVVGACSCIRTLPLFVMADSGPIRRVHAPYFAGDVSFSQAAILWFGQVTPTTNYYRRARSLR